MDVVLESKNLKMKINYMNFEVLKETIAEEASPEIASLYRTMIKSLYGKDDPDLDRFIAIYRKQEAELKRQFKNMYDGLFTFLQKSECEGEISSKDCEDIYCVTTNYNGNNKKIHELNGLLKDCIENESELKWY